MRNLALINAMFCFVIFFVSVAFLICGLPMPVEALILGTLFAPVLGISMIVAAISNLHGLDD